MPEEKTVTEVEELKTPEVTNPVVPAENPGAPIEVTEEKTEDEENQESGFSKLMGKVRQGWKKLYYFIFDLDDVEPKSEAEVKGNYFATLKAQRNKLQRDMAICGNRYKVLTKLRLVLTLILPFLLTMNVPLIWATLDAAGLMILELMIGYYHLPYRQTELEKKLDRLDTELVMYAENIGVYEKAEDKASLLKERTISLWMDHDTSLMNDETLKALDELK